MDNIMKNVRVILCPTLAIAEDSKIAFESQGLKVATCEAEFGASVVEGSSVLGPWATLAHHDTRSYNPPPCIWNTTGNGNISPVIPDIILISHLDLDCLGGVGLLIGYYNENEQVFWKAAAHIDIAGPHRILEVPEEARPKLRAFWAYNESHRQPQFPKDTTTDVTSVIAEYFIILEKLANNDAELIKAGEDWENKKIEQTEGSLVYESGLVRGFAGPYFTAASYCGSDSKVRPCTISYSTKKKSITLAFEAGKESPFSAVEIMQEIFGNESGGHRGIAGTPRGGVYNVFDLTRVIEHVEALMNK